jgi:lysophospholipase L1-like esterase
MRSTRDLSVRRGLAGNLLLALAAILLPFLLLEGGLRLYHVYVKARSSLRRSDNPNLIFVRKPHARRDFNALGFRDREHAVEKPAGMFRIIALGDSVTEGYEIDESDMYTRKLQSLLDRHGGRYEILNFGTSQYSTMQEVEVFKESGLMMGPDLVILGYVLNDASMDGSANDFFRRDRAPSLALEWFARNARAALRIRPRSDWLPGCHRFDYYSRMHCDAGKWARVSASLRELGELARRHGFRVVMVVFPLMEDGAESFAGYKWRDVHTRVIEEAARHGFASLDLLPPFARWRPADVKVAPDDRVHPNKLGHEIAAYAIYRQLLDMGVVSRATE